MREMIDNMVETLERARSLGAVLKLKEMFVGLTTRDTTFELLGYALERDFLRIPMSKKMEMMKINKTKKFVTKLVNQTAFYGMFSTQFSEVLSRMRREIERQKD